MRRDLGDGFELDDDPARVDLDAVHGTSRTTRTGRSDGRARRSSGSSAARRGSSRSSTTAARSASAVRSRTARRSSTSPTSTCSRPTAGAASGLELVREMVEGSELRERKWLLHTEDAHGLYTQARLHRAELQGDGAPAGRRLSRSGAAAARFRREACRHPDRTPARRARRVASRRRHVRGAAGDAADGVDRVRRLRRVRLHADKGYEGARKLAACRATAVSGPIPGRCVMTGA